jgi:hypothetical protein
MKHYRVVVLERGIIGLIILVCLIIIFSSDVREVIQDFFYNLETDYIRQNKYKKNGVERAVIKENYIGFYISEEELKKQMDGIK